jgi:DNA-binding winged helix-turn-helix (wHTH) protein
MPRFLYRFGHCTVDPGARELRRAGELLVLSPKVFDCLAYLIEHRDRAVGRDELIAAVWGRLDVTDALLGQAMLKARRAVADSGDEQNAIRTIPRFGYRWIAEVTAERLPDLPGRADVDACARIRCRRPA